VSLLGDPRFEINVSVALVLEYEDVLTRQVAAGPLTSQDVATLLDYVCDVANQRTVFFRWRPFLVDPKDDFILELAVEAGCDFIVTFNRRDFAGVESFGIRVVTPGDFLRMIGDNP
jgi:predicted nucleic acid-binding protein